MVSGVPPAVVRLGEEVCALTMGRYEVEVRFLVKEGRAKPLELAEEDVF